MPSVSAVDESIPLILDRIENQIQESRKLAGITADALRGQLPPAPSATSNAPAMNDVKSRLQRCVAELQFALTDQQDCARALGLT